MIDTSDNKAKYDELKAYINQMKGEQGPLMPIMQKAQDIFGALTFDVQNFIAEEMQIPMSLHPRSITVYLYHPPRLRRIWSL